MKRRTFLGAAAAAALSGIKQHQAVASQEQEQQESEEAPPQPADENQQEDEGAEQGGADADEERTPSPYATTIGLQLHSVRNELEMDLATTLQAVADAGYQQVELPKTLGADKMVEAARDVGLEVTSAFMNWETIGNPDGDGPELAEVIDKANEFGLRYLVFGYLAPGHRETADHFKRHADSASVAGEQCQAAGIQLCYHNHAFEFRPLEEKQTGFDIFRERFHRDFVKFELDVFWARIAGKDPIKLLKSMERQAVQVHLKDLVKQGDRIYDEATVPEEAFTELGKGCINMAKLLKACEANGVVQCHVEQDFSPNPLESARISREFMNNVQPPQRTKRKDGEAHDDPFG